MTVSPARSIQEGHAHPLVSVITPTYNATRFIRETIDSVKRQTYPYWELILVDDCSSDETVSLIQEELHDPRIRLIVLPKNSGAAVARNTGISAAGGKYLAFLDSDDLWLSEKLEKQVTYMQHHDVAFTFTRYRMIRENGTLTPFVVTIPQEIDYNGLLKNTIIGCLTVMLDRDKLGLVQMPNIRTRQDTALWLQILRAGHVAYGIQEELSQYRQVEGSISSNKWKAARNTWRLYRDIEKLSLVRASWCFLHYGWNAWRKRVDQRG
ncbi:glycosyltransferase family 2 protein [Brevibacillus choshinensis]|uniref:Glycosyltransferase family 2 protein n=1 Tax=Brevibacillus choshinensis TaxID=54911 RepID=A0ABX7FKS1_BRECH|nr:glycosyltransferase family 2 protein [Brevibacillus choshinensis]QRG66239.1 glycosyltransferase family 2 protein [Brevibacillus choshinensis]